MISDWKVQRVAAEFLRRATATRRAPAEHEIVYLVAPSGHPKYHRETTGIGKSYPVTE